MIISLILVSILFCFWGIWICTREDSKKYLIIIFVILSVLLPFTAHGFMGMGKFINQFTARIFYGSRSYTIISYQEINQDKIAIWIKNNKNLPEYIVIPWKLEIINRLNSQKEKAQKEKSGRKSKIKFGKKKISIGIPIKIEFPKKPVDTNKNKHPGF